MSLNCWILPSVTQYPTEMEKRLRKLQFPHLLCMWGIFLMAAVPQPFARMLQEHSWHLLLGSLCSPFLSHRSLSTSPLLYHDSGAHWLCFSQLFMSHKHFLDACCLLDSSLLSFVLSMSTCCNNHKWHWMFHQNSDGYMTIIGGKSYMLYTIVGNYYKCIKMYWLFAHHKIILPNWNFLSK